MNKFILAGKILLAILFMAICFAVVAVLVVAAAWYAGDPAAGVAVVLVLNVIALGFVFSKQPSRPSQEGGK